MFGLFKRKDKVLKISDDRLKVDFHSHLIPDIDDGVKTVDESIDILTELSKQGVEKVITTPHIISDLYPNTRETIKAGEAKVREAIEQWNLKIEFEAAAEYYLDEWFVEHAENETDQLLTFSGKHILVETNYMEKPHFMEQTIFDLRIAGFNVILAHPERYRYLMADYKQFEKLHDTGVIFQLNLLSLAGHYGPEVKKAAEFLVKNNWVEMVGSDIHKMAHAKILRQLKYRASYHQLMDRPLLNNQL
jgi:tyrosine-protein phosphatase YwqE